MALFLFEIAGSHHHQSLSKTQGSPGVAAMIDLFGNEGKLLGEGFGEVWDGES